MSFASDGKRLTIDSHWLATCDQGALESHPKAIMNTLDTDMRMLRAMQYLVKSLCQCSGLNACTRHNTAVRAEEVADI